MRKYLCLFLGLIFLQSCTGTYEENEKRAKELYGECDHPGKNLRSNKSKYQECKARERAGGKSFFDLEGDLNDLIGKGNSQVIYQYSVNPFLWNASLEVTQSYPLKIADNQGGFLETDWISEPGSDMQRCLIKVRITSQDLVMKFLPLLNIFAYRSQARLSIQFLKSHLDCQQSLTGMIV